MPAPCDPDGRVSRTRRSTTPRRTTSASATRCRAGDVPLGSTTRGALATALANGTLPAFSFVTPNLCNDMHDCGVATGDAWLGSWLDEDHREPELSGRPDGRLRRLGRGRRLGRQPRPAFVISPWTKPGTRSTSRFTHYSLLRTTEELLGLRTHLGDAATATSMRSAFGL